MAKKEGKAMFPAMRKETSNMPKGKSSKPMKMNKSSGSGKKGCGCGGM